MSKISENDKRQIIALATKGQNANTIRSRFKHYTRRQIAAIIAWVTMGNYGCKKAKKEGTSVSKKVTFGPEELAVLKKHYPDEGVSGAIAVLRRCYAKLTTKDKDQILSLAS